MAKKVPRSRARRGALGIAMAAAVLTAGGSASAEPRGVDWGKTITELDKFVRTGERQSAPAPKKHHERLSLGDEPNVQNMGNAWFGVAPKVTLVARDWASSTRLAGERLSLVDGLRLSASTRMVVSRARLSNARFAPFVQLGVGQWRVDRNLNPHMQRYVEIASQLGTGFELRLTRRWQVAGEVSATSLIREQRDAEPTAVPQGVLWSASLASRVEF